MKQRLKMADIPRSRTTLQHVLTIKGKILFIRDLIPAVWKHSPFINMAHCDLSLLLLPWKPFSSDM